MPLVTPPPLIAKEVETIPPWEREDMRLDEVPAFLKRCYNMHVQKSTVYRWAKKGLIHRSEVHLNKPLEQKARVYLVLSKRARRTYVRRKDLIAFLETT